MYAAGVPFRLNSPRLTGLWDGPSPTVYRSGHGAPRRTREHNPLPNSDEVLLLPPKLCDRILVLDDNRDMLASLREVLEEGGSTVETATSIQEAERRLDTGFQPMAFLLDLRLSDNESGETFAKRLRSDPRYSATPIVLFSGDDHALDEQSVADKKLTKPFGIDNLFQALSEVCVAQL